MRNYHEPRPRKIHGHRSAAFLFETTLLGIERFFLEPFEPSTGNPVLSDIQRRTSMLSHRPINVRPTILASPFLETVFLCCFLFSDFLGQSERFCRKTLFLTKRIHRPDGAKDFRRNIDRRLDCSETFLLAKKNVQTIVQWRGRGIGYFPILPAPGTETYLRVVSRPFARPAFFATQLSVRKRNPASD